MKNNSEETSVPWVFKIKNYQFREMYMYDESALATLIISELKSLYSIDNFSKDQLITITSLHKSINLLSLNRKPSCINNPLRAIFSDN